MFENAWFTYESGQAWCEAAYKYQTLPMVAEFANTLSTLPIMVLPLLNAFMVKEYISRVNQYALLPHILLSFNGIVSSYYHATLNLFGQLVDELSILWLLDMCVIAFLPTFRQFLCNNIRYGFVAFALIVSILCFVNPAMNAFALMSFSIPGFALIYVEGARGENPEAERIAFRVFKLWTCAAMFWFMDKSFCDLWIYLGTPYFHALFHLCGSMAGYNTFLMFSLLDVERRRKIEKHSFQAKIQYFPSEKSWINLPYLALTDRLKQKGHFEECSAGSKRNKSKFRFIGWENFSASTMLCHQQQKGIAQQCYVN